MIHGCAPSGLQWNRYWPQTEALCAFMSMKGAAGNRFIY